MCDCFWPECRECETRVPLHIADFCMPREAVSTFCPRHLPDRNVVVYELVEEAYRPGDGLFDPPRGWRMGVRYIEPPPGSYGLQAAEPNTCSGYLAEYRTPRGGRYYFTGRSPRRHRTERAAILATLRDVERSSEQHDGQDPQVEAWLESERRTWTSMKRQCELMFRIGDLVDGMPLVQDLRGTGDLISLVLIGSLRNRDFVPGLSDIDLWVLGRRLKPGLRVEYISERGQDLEVNLVCRNKAFLRRMLRARNPVDLVAIRHGAVLFDEGLVERLRLNADWYRASSQTRSAWMSSSARWLSMAIQQYFSPHCAHCFFGALYHAARDLLRAHLVGDGEDVTEGWEVEAAVADRWPDLAELYGRIRHARTSWDSFPFPLLEERTRIDGQMGELLTVLEGIARPVYLSYGLRLPRFVSFFDGFVRRAAARRFNFVHISPTERMISVGYENVSGKYVLASRKMRRSPGTGSRIRSP